MAPVALIAVIPHIWGQNGADARIMGLENDPLAIWQNIMGMVLEPWQIAQFRAFGKTTLQYRLIEPISMEEFLENNIYPLI